MAVCIAVIGKDNSPLFLRTSSPDYELKFRFAVHTSLDVVEEKISSSSRGTGDFRELYLGLLYPTEDYKIFGYVTNTHIKFIVIVELSNTSIRDNEIRSMFRKLHNAYTDLVCNPFYIIDESIVSKSFENVVKGMMLS